MFESARLELTGRCDMKCLYCHAGEKNTDCYNSDELPHSRWLEIVAECKRLGVKNFILTGGEPFLYKQWPEIVSACGEDARVVFSTNGKYFSDANLAVLENFPQVKEFRTSIDGLAINDIIRDGSSYLESLENIRRLKRKFPDSKVMIQTVVYQQNLFEIFALYQVLKDIGIYCWRLSQLWKTVRTEKNRNILDFSNYEKMFDFLAEVIKTHQRDGKPFLLRIDNVYYSWIENEDYTPMDLYGHSYSCCMMPMIETKIFPLLSDRERKAFESLVDRDGYFPQIHGKNIEQAICSFLKEKKGGGNMVIKNKQPS